MEAAGARRAVGVERSDSLQSHNLIVGGVTGGVFDYIKLEEQEKERGGLKQEQTPSRHDWKIQS